MILDKAKGCITKIEGEMIVKKCGDQTMAVCFTGTRSKSGGLNVLGSGANGSYGYPDFHCVSMEEIKERIKKAKK
jgi:hypothetical protein